MTPPKGLNTIVGYATALILALAAAATTILNSIDQTSVPPWVIALLLTLAALGERVTGLSRVSQVNAATKAQPKASQLLASSIAPMVSGTANPTASTMTIRFTGAAADGPGDPGDLDAVDPASEADAPAEQLPALEG